jgi:hypothetical protein
MAVQNLSASFAASAEVNSPVSWLNSTANPVCPNNSTISRTSSPLACHFSSSNQ